MNYNLLSPFFTPVNRTVTTGAEVRWMDFPLLYKAEKKKRDYCDILGFAVNNASGV